MAKTVTKTRSKRRKTAKPSRGRTLVEVFGGVARSYERAGLYPPRVETRVATHARLVSAVRKLLVALALDAAPLRANVRDAIAAVEELLP